MKVFFLTIPAILFLSNVSSGQIECDPPNTFLNIAVNEINAMLSTGGDIFWDRRIGEPGFQTPNHLTDSATYSIFTANFWVQGLDEQGSRRYTTETYPNNIGYNWTSGPLNENGLTTEHTCKKWDILFSATKEEIESHNSDFEDNGVIDNIISSIFSWPGNGNTHFSDYHGFELPDNAGGLAPFNDLNSNGIYEPSLGEYPLPERVNPNQIPDIIVWWVFNDIGHAFPSAFGDRLGLEVHSTIYAYESTNSAINRTIFRSIKLLPKLDYDFQQLNVGLWTDFDIGCFEDDYIGSIPEMNAYYGYNADAIDGNPDTSSTCGDFETYRHNPPVQSVSFLNNDMNSFIGYYSGNVPGISDPYWPTGFINLMNGKWVDGAPLTYGGNGYNLSSEEYVDYLYPDIPTDTSGWSMYADTILMGDMKALGLTKYFDVSKGDEINLDMAYSFHQEEGNNNLENVVLMYEQIPLVHEFYNGITTSTEDVAFDETSIIELFPNPTIDHLFFKSNDMLQMRGGQYKIRSVNGSFLQSGVMDNSGININLDPGIYLIEIENEGRTVVQKFIVGEN